jgi:DNA-binding NarL/FixJ family response regulator
VLLAEDHALVRAGLHALLVTLHDVSVVGEASDGREAVSMANDVHPDVVLMDISMPGLSGLEALERLTRELPTTRVIIVSMYANEEYVWQALRSGAAGYLLKNASAGELGAALAAVGRGETYLSPSISTVLTDYIRRVGAEGPAPSRLTSRQREVLQLIAEGSTNRKIGETLGISVKTVESHRSQLMDTLDIHDIAGLVRYAMKVGLIRAN